LRLALDRRSAPLIFAWLERSRAQAFRVRPVRPPADPQAATILAELRQLSYLERNAELSGRRDPAVTARRTELKRQLREHSWQASGPGDTAAPARLSDVCAALAQSHQIMISLLRQSTRLLAVLLHDGAARLVELGDFGTAAEAARRLNVDLDTLAGRRRPPAIDAAIRASVRHHAQALSREILAPVRAVAGDEGIVIVPMGELASIPWNLLPELRGRPVTVSPSASRWLESWDGSQTARDSPGRPPLLLAGPYLRHTAGEITEIAAMYPGSQPLLGETATVSAALQALDGARLAHLAAHGHHDRENFLFSRLDLADGPLMAYDVQQLAAPPRHVVLSACDVGQAVVRPGEEFLGFTAALLYSGTETVISSVTRVADDDAAGVMTAYHRALAAGARPAAALAEAARTEPLSPFVCFGCG
jgi:hypothetical protein